MGQLFLARFSYNSTDLRIYPTARAYFLSGAYERAEGVLDELIPTIDASKNHVRRPIFRG